MLEKNNIKGEYYFDINIYTMFHTYNILCKNHNLITNNGISFFLNRCVSNPSIVESESGSYDLNDEWGVISKIGVGKNNKTPSLTDTSLTDAYFFDDVNIDVDGNQIIMTTETDGVNIDETTEIGVYTSTNLLISRDVHSEYSVPSTATVKLTYIFTLSQTDESLENEEDEND